MWGWQNFISNLTQHLAWPITVLSLSFLFRKEITLLISRVKKIGYVEFEVSQEVKNELEKASPEIIEEVKSYLDIPEADLTTVFLSNFIDFESSIRSLYKVRFKTDKKTPLNTMLKQLKSQEIVDDFVINGYRDTVYIRNCILHEGLKLPSNSKQYIELIVSLKSRVKNLEILHNWESCNS